MIFPSMILGARRRSAAPPTSPLTLTARGFSWTNADLSTRSVNIGSTAGTKTILVVIAGQLESTPTGVTLGGQAVTELRNDREGLFDQIWVGQISTTLTGTQTVSISPSQQVFYRWAVHAFEIGGGTPNFAARKTVAWDASPGSRTYTAVPAGSVMVACGTGQNAQPVFSSSSMTLSLQYLDFLESSFYGAFAWASGVGNGGNLSMSYNTGGGTTSRHHGVGLMIPPSS